MSCLENLTAVTGRHNGFAVDMAKRSDAVTVCETNVVVGVMALSKA